LYRIAIAGFGFVGSALYNALKTSIKCEIYDPAFNEHNLQDDLLVSDVVFICVPTPENDDGSLDSSAVNDNLDFLSDNNYNGLVVIKSTILPDYLNIPNNLRVVSNPEFLKEVSANDDFKNQELILIGGRADLCYCLEDIYRKAFDINYKNVEYVSFNEALQFKYLRNIKIAYDVMFLENIQSTVGNYQKYINIMSKLPVNINRIRLDGEPGYGGHCLPKDVNAFNFTYNDKLTKYLKDMNEIRFSNRTDSSS